MSKIKKLKPKNHIFLAMSKRSGAGSHTKPNKSMRLKERNSLKKDLKKILF